MKILNEDTRLRVADLMLNANIITIADTRLASGIVSPIYFDCRKLISYPKIREEILKIWSQSLDINDIDHFCGLESGGIPYASFLAQILGHSMIYARKKNKDYGKKNLIEGKFVPGDKILFVDDVLSTGASKEKFIDNIKINGLQYAGCTTILYYGIFDIHAAIHPIHYLCTINDIIHRASERQLFTNDEILKIKKGLNIKKD